ncbi:MAG: hypothetical protein ACP5U2_12510 [Bryobacteraceae bacterium]
MRPRLGAWIGWACAGWQLGRLPLFGQRLPLYGRRGGGSEVCPHGRRCAKVMVFDPDAGDAKLGSGAFPAAG